MCLKMTKNLNLIVKNSHTVQFSLQHWSSGVSPRAGKLDSGFLSGRAGEMSSSNDGKFLLWNIVMQTTGHE